MDTQQPSNLMKAIYGFITKRPILLPALLGIIGACCIVWISSKLNDEIKYIAAEQGAEQHLEVILSLQSILQEQTLSSSSEAKPSILITLKKIQAQIEQHKHGLSLNVYSENEDLSQDQKKILDYLKNHPNEAYEQRYKDKDQNIYQHAILFDPKGQSKIILEITIPLDKLEQHTQISLIQLIIALSILGFVVLTFLYITLRGMKWQQQAQTHALEQKVQERTQNLAEQNQQLEQTMQNLKEAQNQLVLQEKMASIGVLTAGIAHEIKNPLNFINNFADMTVDMLDELKEEIEQIKDLPKDSKEILEGIIEDIAVNCNKINEHGKRAESTVKNMLIQSRDQDDTKLPTDLNNLVEEYLNLAYHGMRAQDSDFNVKMVKEFDEQLPQVTVSQQSIGRVVLNIINNGLYASNERKEKLPPPPEDFMPTITVKTSHDDQNIYVDIIDNGVGISEEAQKKIFEPFYTTKPAGAGTGLGLPICYEIIVEEHKGDLKVESKVNEWTKFTIVLPLDEIQ